MVSFIVRMRFDAADRERVLDLLRELTVASRQEPGCVSYIPHTLEADPATVLLYEQYRDQAALEFHRNTPHFQKFVVDGIFPLMRGRELENLSAIG